MSMLSNLLSARLLFNEAPSGEGGPGSGAPGGGGDAPKFTQADMDRVVTERVRKLTDELKSLKSVAGEVEALKQRAAEFEAEKAKAAEEAELKGKSDAEKALIQFRKAEERAKQLESESAKSRADYEAKIKARDEAIAAKTKRYGVIPAIAAGAAEGAANTALREFLASADVQLDDAGEDVASVTYEGKTYEKVSDAVKAFYERVPFLAKPPAGGSGSPRTPGGPVTAGQKLREMSPEAALSDLFGGR